MLEAATEMKILDTKKSLKSEKLLITNFALLSFPNLIAQCPKNRVLLIGEAWRDLLKE